jgi:hypothetical protein
LEEEVSELEVARQGQVVVWAEAEKELRRENG